ncbi:MAG: glycosyltransferase family 2 protein [Asticcacaulis sp.]
MTFHMTSAQLIQALSMEPSCDVAVVMVVYKTGPVLFETIARVQSDPAVDQLILVDNGSTEEDADRLATIADMDPRVLLLQGHGNIGFARGANLGASVSKARWLVFLNPDAFLEPGAVDALIDAARGAVRPAVIGARVLNPDRSEQRGGRRGEVTPFTTLVSLARLANFFPALKAFEIHKEHEVLPEGPMSVPTISGACFCVSRDDFRKLRGFDGRYFLHVEDVDLCWRARKQGGVVLFQPSAEVIHLGHTSHVEPTFVEWNKGKGLVRYFLKRADSLPRQALAIVLAPLILAVSLIRSYRPR